MKLKWQQAPVKTQWGDDMVVASVAIDKDHTVCLYCERDQTDKVDAMFAKREWAGLTGAERLQIEKDMMKYYDYKHECKTVCLPEFARAIEAKLKEKHDD